jgi:hypothetical protein
LKRAVAITLLLLLPTAVYGAIYGWIDSAGTAHYTNRESEIPPAYRDKAKLIVREPSDPPAPLQIGQTPTSPQSTARSEEPPTVAPQPAPEMERQNAGKAPVVKRHGRRSRNPRDATGEE